MNDAEKSPKKIKVLWLYLVLFVLVYFIAGFIINRDPTWESGEELLPGQFSVLVYDQSKNELYRLPLRHVNELKGEGSSELPAHSFLLPDTAEIDFQLPADSALRERDSSGRHRFKVWQPEPGVQIVTYIHTSLYRRNGVKSVYRATESTIEPLRQYHNDGSMYAFSLALFSIFLFALVRVVVRLCFALLSLLGKNSIKGSEKLDP